MAPLKPLNKQTTLANLDRGIKTRSQIQMKKDVLPKRKAEESPLKRITVKRSAFGEVTNHVNSKENDRSELNGKAAVKQATVTSRETRSRSLSRTRKPLSSVNANKPPIPPASKVPLKDIQAKATVTSKPKVLADVNDTKEKVNNTGKALIVKTTALVGILPRPIKTQVKTIKKSTEPTVSSVKATAKPRTSDAGDKSDSSLYVSALEDLNLDDGVKSGKSKKKQRKPPPPGVTDFDKENINEPNSVSIYAMDIFEYLKSRESHFPISDYMCRQPDLNSSMRALVVSWMVEVQENFELNHETLYLAVKLFDLYLSKVRITKDRLQLIGCASLFVSAKYDERYPPCIDDMIYVCDGLYTPDDLTSMEKELLKAVDFQLGIPLSYRFLRRYSRCIKLGMPTLTLARYILETCLLDYSTIRFSDSKLACAALHLALIMSGQKKWTPSLEYYSGYKSEEFKDIMKTVNNVLHIRSAKEHVIRVKYAHKVFHEVSKVPLVKTADL
ncbi:hypothetical protein O3M35_004899 [Rhynocoris fuscipes]|uniref:G2/mitotic-specific cyclin-B3 n=1 Tax=Rhynocoris fuscipes TaxID=488301 RepID=A0AAW1DH37_9HEMI